MFLRRALRYRWAQALVLTGISLLIGACAVFGPWFARAVEQTVMTETLSGQSLPASWLLASPGPQVGISTRPEDLDKLLPSDLKPLFTPPLHGIYNDVSWSIPATAGDPSPGARVRWRNGYCAQLDVTEGRCPKAANEVIASTVDKTTWEFRLGTTLAATPSDVGKGGGRLTIVGFYQPKEARGDFWYGDYPTGHSHKPADKDPGAANEFFTDSSTFAGTNWTQRVTSDFRPIPGVARLDDLERLKDATETVNGNAREIGVPAQNTSSLATLVDQIQAERKQATTIIPLVMVQVALFAVVVLALALAAVVDQRRPEIALSRLRGSSARRTQRALCIELGLPVLVGTLLGGLAGFALLLVVRATLAAVRRTDRTAVDGSGRAGGSRSTRADRRGAPGPGHRPAVDLQSAPPRAPAAARQDDRRRGPVHHHVRRGRADRGADR
jgi:hypothetical protein